MTKQVQIGSVAIGGGAPLALIAGPCVIEDPARTLAIGRDVQRIAAKLGMPYIFKASFDKANRSSYQSFRGPGLTEGLNILARIKRELGVPVLSDIHEAAQAAAAAAVLDVLQIPAFLCRQTDLLLAAGRTGRPEYVQVARRCAEVILDAAETADGRRRWRHAEHRDRPDFLQAQTGYMQGAAGIASFLQHLSGTLAGAPVKIRAPDWPPAKA